MTTENMITETAPPAQARPDLEVITELDIAHIQTEDDKPVDNIFSERQQRLLVGSLYAGWKAAEPFVALSNIGLFYGLHRPPIVPDMMLSLRVQLPQGDAVHEKRHRAYFAWEYAKVPEVVVEIVSNRKGNEFDEKMQIYADIGVVYYIIYDPEQHYGEPALRLFQLNGGVYVQESNFVLERVGLRIGLWQGVYEGTAQAWLRWYDERNQLILTAEERSKEAEARAEKLAQKLREAGINPDDV
jgi:Uma2 family endonuclease